MTCLDPSSPATPTLFDVSPSSCLIAYKLVFIRSQSRMVAFFISYFFLAVRFTASGWSLSVEVNEIRYATNFQSIQMSGAALKSIQSGRPTKINK